MSDIGVRLTGDNSEYRSMLNDSVEKGAEFSENLTTRVGDHLLGLRHVSTAVATALGLNLEHIAENIARFVTGVSKESEDALKGLETLSTEIADQNIASMRALLSVEDQHKLALQDRVKILGKIKESQEATNSEINIGTLSNIAAKAPLMALFLLYKQREETSRATVELFEREKELKKDDAEIEKTRLAIKQKQQTIDQDMATYDRVAAEQAIKRMGYSEKISELEQVVADAKERMAKAEMGSVEQGKILLEVQKAQSAVADEHLKHEEAGRLSIKEQESEAVILADTKGRISDSEVVKARTIARLLVEQNNDVQNINEEQHAHLNILTLQTDQKNNQRDIDELLKQGVENLSDTQFKTLRSLEEQTKQDQIQIDLQQKLITGAAARKSTEMGVTDEYDKQVAEAMKLNSEFEKLILTVKRSGASYDQQSTASLTGVRARLESQLHGLGNEGEQIKDATVSGDYGAWLTANSIKGELQAVVAELDLRAKVQSYDQQYGQTATTQQFGDTVTQRALRDMTNVQQQTATTLAVISNQLTASGIFPPGP